MARKTMAKKLKKSNKTRCSPSDVAKLLEKLSSEQKAVVRDMGFGALENLSILNISKKIMMELVDSFNTNDNSMRTSLLRIKLDASKIGDALGLNARDDEARPPWISYWRGDRLKERLKLEKKDSTVNHAGAEIIAAAAEAAPLNPLPENPAAAAPIETLPPNAAPAVAQINQLAENADAAVDPPSQGVAAIDDVLVTPQDCEIEVVEATSAEEELISRELNESTTRLVVETTVEKGDIVEKESVIEVVEATSAEEELIRRDLSESIANLVVETNVEKGDIAEKESVIEQLTHKYWESNREPKENVETHKEVHEEIKWNIMMIAKTAVAQGDIGPLPSFDLGIDFGSQSQSQSQPEKEKEPAQEIEKHDQDVQK
ncbi:hypothetical protein PIB30_064605 [Stylosanthes scabra]|uniref:Uncharacterized protein n=1 Tax=Stylosanthes scabra TaxID=79078 RepID=A0ABU6QLP4_9FABA|nr:hypothetical protein [Stylosanthes scabra]